MSIHRSGAYRSAIKLGKPTRFLTTEHPIYKLDVDSPIGSLQICHQTRKANKVPYNRAPYLQVGCRYTYRELTDLPSNSESQQGSLQQSTLFTSWMSIHRSGAYRSAIKLGKPTRFLTTEHPIYKLDVDTPIGSLQICHQTRKANKFPFNRALQLTSWMSIHLSGAYRSAIKLGKPTSFLTTEHPIYKLDVDTPIGSLQICHQTRKANKVPYNRAPYLQVGCRYTYRELTDLPSNSESQQGSFQQSTPIDKSRSTLNNSLIPRDISSIRSSLQFPCSEASGRTKRYYANPRTYIQTHTPTMVQGEVGWLEPPSVTFLLRYDILKSF